MYSSIDVIMALVPFVMLLAAFLVFRMEALEASLSAWLVEFVAVLVYYRMPYLRVLQASLWGVLTIWTGFLVLYTGQIFGQAYRSTGLLQILLRSVESFLPSDDQRVRSLALVTVVGGFIGAFNGFATYPVTIPGLVELGFDGFQAVTSYLAYFSWTLPFNSLFIAPNISSVATHVPVADIAHVAGLISLPLVFISLLGFLKLLGFRFLDLQTQLLLWLVWLANAAGIVLCTQIWPNEYILMMIAGAAFSLGGLYVYVRIANGHASTPPVVRSVSAAGSPADAYAASPTSGGTAFRAYAPLMLGVALVLLKLIPSAGHVLDGLNFSVAAWGYQPVSVNIVTAAGFYIFVTALACYPFSARPVNVFADLVIASRRAWRSMATLFVGSAMVYLMVETNQIGLLGNILAGGGKYVYAALFPIVAFLGAIAFGQGLPGNFLFSRMQVPVAPMLGIPLAVLVGIVVVIAMGPPNALKPTQIAYSTSLADAKGREAQIFRTCLPWQLLQLAVTAVISVILVLIWT